MTDPSSTFTVKQEIFYSDVTVCYNTLKKAVADLYTASLGAAELHAGQASLRYGYSSRQHFVAHSSFYAHLVRTFSPSLRTQVLFLPSTSETYSV